LTDIEYWGIPKGVCDQIYEHTKIRKLFDWQADCLAANPQVVQGSGNLVYFAPTSGGKSMVSEIILLKHILGFKKRAMYILPFVSIVTEKEQYLTKLT
jgi:DNA polymerase theta